MASLCDDIARFICDALKETQQIDLQRNLLAERFRCAPSQITYVLSTRFTPQNGYHVESRRGGGGYVRIIRLDALRDQLLLGAIHSVGDRLDASASTQLLRNLTAAGGISPAQARLMRTCLDESVLGDDEEADHLRAKLFCRMLTCVLEEG